ncbi:hypothetical protein ACYZTR_19520 [Pseudomonas sp. Hz4]
MSVSNKASLGLDRGRNVSKYLCYVVASVVFVRILQYGWVTDDAFITFRSVLNFVNGDGAVFNIGERVQSYTHPLWFMLLSVGGFLDLNLYFFSIILGLGFSLLTLLVLFRIHCAVGSQNNNLSLLVALGVLGASESFVSFATSGLENSATYFLVSMVVLSLVDGFKRFWFYFFVSLAILNRFDNIFILTPLVCVIAYCDIRLARFRFWTAAFAFLPLVAWHITSLIYYGFLFPNTKYAKVGGRTLMENAVSGMDYLLDSVQSEWHVWMIIAVLPLISFYALRKKILSNDFRIVFAAVVAGIYLHVVYVLLVAGGDFMRGRFFTVALLFAVIALLFVRFEVKVWKQVVTVVVCAVAFTNAAWIGAKEYYLWPMSVTNERNYYKGQLGLNLDPQQNYTMHPWAVKALSLGDAPRLVGVVGQRGYWMPRQTYLLDKVGLTDAFVARLKIKDHSRTGHFQRDIPKEYLSKKIKGINVPKWKDESAQELSDKLSIVTESPDLFSEERFRNMYWLWRSYGI